MGLVSLLFNFHGRINRAQYWMGSIGVGFAAGLLCVLAFVAAMPDQPDDKAQAARAAGLLFVLLGLVWAGALWSSLAIQVKRFHDRGQSGFWSLLPIVPMIGMFMAAFGAVAGNYSAPQAFAAVQPYVGVLWLINLGFFINLGCLGGTDGPNKYGDPPGSPRTYAPQPQAPSGAQPAMSSLFGAQSAIDRAIAEQQMRPAPAPRPRPAMATPATAGAAPSFGRRSTR